MLSLKYAAFVLITAGVHLQSAIAQPTAGVVNQTTCNGQEYAYQQLAGYGYVASDSRDRFGDTIGGIGSSIAIDRRTWFKWGNGTYMGILWALPGQYGISFEHEPDSLT